MNSLVLLFALFASQAEAPYPAIGEQIVAPETPEEFPPLNATEKLIVWSIVGTCTILYVRNLYLRFKKPKPPEEFRLKRMDVCGH